jgi:hypothetical protein
MARYLPVRAKGASVAIAICTRCSFKVPYDSLKKDPNTKQMICESCVDLYDPWRKPARRPENITLQYPRPDSSVSTVDIEDFVLGTESLLPIEFPTGIEIGTNP